MTLLIPHQTSRLMTSIIAGVVIVTLLLSSSITAQEVRITVSDATAKQGDLKDIEVTGTIADTIIDSVRISVNYNANRLKIDSVTGGNEYALQCLQPSFIDQVSISDGVLEISCSNIKQTTDGKLFVLHCTILAGTGTVAEIAPVECFVNGIKKEGILSIGTITIDDIPVTVKFKEGIGFPFENPSYTTIRIPYSIDNPTKVSFTLYDILGRIVEDISPIERTQGIYEFNYIPRDGVFANGAYFVKMTTDSKVYFTYFMRIR